MTLAWLATHRNRLRSLHFGGHRLSIVFLWDDKGRAEVDHSQEEVDALVRVVYGPLPTVDDATCDVSRRAAVLDDMRRVAIICTRPACGHGPGRHEAGGACQDCACTAFTLEEPRRLTRCSECKRRPKRDGAYWGNHLGWCSRQGEAPNAYERELTSGPRR